MYHDCPKMGHFDSTIMYLKDADGMRHSLDSD